MGKRIILSVTILVFIIFAGPVYAALIDRGTGMIYDTDLGITWLQNTAMSGSPFYEWSLAANWAEQLEYGGYDDWRLPVSYGTAQGYINDGEMAYLYYTELGNAAGGPLINSGPFVFPNDSHPYWLGTPGLHPGSQWAFQFYDGFLNAWNEYNCAYAWAVRDGDYGPSVSTGSDYVANLILGDTFSFDYWWQMSQEPTGFNMDIFFLRDNSWHLLGGDINFDGSSSAWENISLIVPHELQGLQTQIRFSVYDFGADTDPTIYLRNIASNGTAPVPEPSTMLLLGAGLFGLAGFRKKLKK